MIESLSALKVSRHTIPAWGRIPNTSIVGRPLLIYHAVFQALPTTASKIEQHLNRLGVVTPQWRYTMYSTSHFHSTTHEVLAISHGKARLCFGHEDNPGKVVQTVQHGDVIVVPAGVAHRLLEDIDGGFEMVGSYPRGCSWDMMYGRQGEEDKIAAIKDIPWFERDPIYGDVGPVLE